MPHHLRSRKFKGCPENKCAYFLQNCRNAKLATATNAHIKSWYGRIIWLFVYLLLAYFGKNYDHCFCKARKTWWSLKCQIAENPMANNNLENSYWTFFCCSSNLKTSPSAYPVATSLNISKISDLNMDIAWSSFILTYTPSQVQYILLCFSNLIHLFIVSS